MEERKAREKAIKQAGWLTIALGGVLLVMKIFAFIISGSAAVLSSLFDTLVDILASGVNCAAVYYSHKPADDNHRYGHGKIEGFASLMQAAFIGSAALFLLLEAVRRYIEQPEISAHFTAGAVILASMIISAVIIAIQNRALGQGHSLALESDQAHYSGDLLMNLGVVATLALHYGGAPIWIDTLFAALIALWLMKTAKDVGGKGMAMLMDQELPCEMRAKIIAIIDKNPEVIDWHDLRTIMSGMRMLVSFDIEVKRSLNIVEAHAISRSLENDILAVFPEAEVMIHIDPEGEPQDSRHPVRS